MLGTQKYLFFISKEEQLHYYKNFIESFGTSSIERIISYMLRILYLGNSPDYSLPSDRRRTFGFLKRFKKKYKLYNHFEKGVKYDILICTIGTDLNKVLSVLPSVKKFVLDYSDNYLIEKSFLRIILDYPSSQ